MVKEYIFCDFCQRQYEDRNDMFVIDNTYSVPTKTYYLSKKVEEAGKQQHYCNLTCRTNHLKQLIDESKEQFKLID